jgi:CO/xanthine dehydrogenase Mo-binding subunit
MKLPKLLYGKILRSSLPHAQIVRIRVEAAKNLPGVKAVITGDDTPKKNGGPIIADEPILAIEKVRYLGDEVAAVAAEDEETAEKALELIEVEYEELPAVYHPETAMEPGAPNIHDGGNVATHFEYERGDVGLGFAESDYVFENCYDTQIQHQGYLEPRACLASADASGRVTVWGGFQSIFLMRRWLAAVLNMSESKVRVVQPYTGGGFGGKITSSKAPIAALLALKTGRPVKIVNSREDEFRAGRPRSPGIIQQKIGVKKDGSLIARQVKVIVDCGAYAGHAPAIARTMAMRAESVYRVSHLKGEGFAVYTNKTPTGAQRGFGVPEGTFALETMVDEIAEALDLDPLELRLKNTIEAGEVTPHGLKIGSCGLRECLVKVTESARWKERQTKKRKSHGFGLACGISTAGYRAIFDYDGSNALVKVEPDGRIILFTGESDTGSGAWSGLCQIVAEELGAAFEDVQISAGDTEVAPYCLGSYAARTTFIGGNAVKAAAADAREQLFKVVGELLEANPDDLEARQSKVYVKGAPSRSISFAEASAASIYRKQGKPILGIGAYDPPTEMPDSKTLYGNVSPSYPFCSHVAEVEVDRATGEVKLLSIFAADDVGRAINPSSIEGQMHGCASQMFGFSLMEDMRFEKGNIINANLMDYKMPVAPDMPVIESTIVESLEPLGPYGAKSASEATSPGVPAAIANAIYNAVAVRIRSLPITPEKILKTLESE